MMFPRFRLCWILLIAALAGICVANSHASRNLGYLPEPGAYPYYAN